MCALYIISKTSASNHLGDLNPSAIAKVGALLIKCIVCLPIFLTLEGFLGVRSLMQTIWYCQCVDNKETGGLQLYLVNSL